MLGKKLTIIVYSILNKKNVKCYVYVNFVIKDKKGSRIFYDIITGVNEVNTHLKWQETLGQINENEWIISFIN